MANEVIITIKVKNEANFDPFKAAFKDIDNAASQASGKMFNVLNASSAAGAGVSILTSAASNLAAIVPAVIGGFIALAPALLAAGGAAGAASTLLAGTAIALATLGIGFGGIGAALSAHTKQMGAAGGAAKNTGEQEYQAAKRIKDATRSLTDAKANERDAAKAVNQARQDEIDRLRELDLALKGQKISQAEAAQSLIEAKEKARRANIAGSDWEKAEANNAVARAQNQYDTITEKLGDLTAEKKKADKDGVEGSDQVQAALKRQADAHQQVLRAQEQLADAHHKTAVAAAGAAGGVNLFNQAMAKLSPNAQKLVYALLDIEKRFDVIKRRVQDRLLAGFDKEVTDLADKWLPHLGNILGSMADHLNRFGKNAMEALGDSTFIKNIQRAGVETGKFIDKLSVSTDSFIDAFGRLAGHSGPVLQKIGDLIERIFVKFDNWIKAADKTGKLDSFMQQAADTLQDIFDIGGLVFTIIGQIIEILFPGSEKTSNGVFDSVRKSLQGVSDWLGDPKNQKRVNDFVNSVMNFMKFLRQYGIPTVEFLVRAIGAIASQSGRAGTMIGALGTMIKRTFTGAWDFVENRTAAVFNWLSKAGRTLGNNLGGIWTGLRNGFRNSINYIIAGWNNLRFTIGGGSWMGMSIPSVSFNTPNIPYLARGGIAGGLAMVGERGRELVRLPQGSTVIPNGTTESMMAQGGGGGGRLMLGFERGSGNRLEDALIEMVQNYVHKRGGNTQVALGRNGAR
jgi:hypothetical protein